MSFRNWANSMSIKNLPYKEKILLSYIISALLPLLIMIYLFLDLVTPELYWGVDNRQYVNVGLIVLLAIILNVMGLTMSLNIGRTYDKGNNKDQDEPKEILQTKNN